MRYLILLLVTMSIACSPQSDSTKTIPSPIIGTWELIASQKTQEGQTETDDLRGKRMIKVINATHFSFMNHDLPSETDSLQLYVSGGGPYSLEGDQYTEFLEYCNYRDWEGYEFTFTVEFRGDTLIQQGLEQIEELGVEQEIREVYLRTDQ